MSNASIIKRIEDKYIPVTESGCWIWFGAADKKGYGRININGKTKLAHRVSFELFNKKIPDGMVIDHLCRVPACINPNHLEVVTLRINTQRGMCAETQRKRQLSKTNCPKGHEYSLKNTYIDPRGYRNCIKCRSISIKTYKEKMLCQKT